MHSFSVFPCQVFPTKPAVDCGSLFLDRITGFGYWAKKAVSLLQRLEIRVLQADALEQAQVPRRDARTAHDQECPCLPATIVFGT